jgi:DNA repair exonuclease SbcCD ATPase subunit
VRLLRLELRHFRGVAERAIDFEPKGVHVIEGPNEAGKSSLLEALDILLEHLDSTTKERVLAVRPVDRDVGTEIAAVIETGPYRFRYSKRFFKERETLLRVEAPRPESLAGREAHERVNEILRKTMDRGLFDALRVRQGAGLAPVDLAAAESLTRALDLAAGKEAAGDREQTLFERVTEEYRRYYTEKGQDGKALRDMTAEAERARAEARDAEADHERIRHAVERFAALEREIAERSLEAEEAEATARRRDSEAEALRQREKDLEKLELRERTTSLEEKAARRESEAREELVRKAAEAERARARLEEAAACEAPLLAGAAARAVEARAAFAAAERSRDAAEANFQLRHADLEMVEGDLKTRLLAGRLALATEARRDKAAAAELVSRTVVTDEWLRRADELQREIERLEARLGAESPSLVLEAERDLALEADGERVRIPAGETLRRAVTGSLDLRIPDLFRLSLRTGRAGEELGRNLAASRTSLAAMLQSAGVADLRAAAEAIGARRDAERTVRECERRIRENLQDLTFEELEQKLANTRQLFERLRRERAAEPPVPLDYDTAKTFRDEAKRARDEAARGLDRLRDAASEAEDRARTLHATVERARVDLRFAVHQEQAARQELALARERESDEAISARLRETEARLRAAREAHGVERRALDELKPDRVRAIAVNARLAADGAQKRLRESEKEASELRGALGESVGKGLFDRREETAARLLSVEAEQASLAARAAAARLLYETMHDCREAARRAYRAPLRERIVTLGRFIFGDAFSVELNDDLSLASRTLNGRTVPFDSLSAGAREQLSLLARVACALLVDPADGAPLILDDALGHSDPERLEGLGAVLAEAGRHCQVIVLTCTPGRFRHVGGAVRVRL